MSNISKADTKKASTTVEITHTGSGCTVPELNLTFKRGETKTVPRWFAEERARVDPSEWTTKEK